MRPDHNEIGVGATEDLSLRVSVATLVRVVFKNPHNEEWMLALAFIKSARRGSLRSAPPTCGTAGIITIPPDLINTSSC
jgi:hypothetical protein